MLKSISLPSFLRNLCLAPGSTEHYRRVYTEILKPCLENRNHVVLGNPIHTVKVTYHDHPNLNIPDYFTALGYILSLQPHVLSFAHPIQLLTLYAKLCKLSSSLIDTRPPTIVQLLWPHSHHTHPFPSLLALGSSIGGQGGPASLTHPEAIRRSKASLLDSLWTHALQHPSPLQRLHSDDVHNNPWERSKWGHCAETVPFAAFHKTLPLTSFTTLALNVAAMNKPDDKTGLSPVDAILGLSPAIVCTPTPTPQRIVPTNELLRSIHFILHTSSAIRPMCINCKHLSRAIGADVLDYGEIIVAQAQETKDLEEARASTSGTAERARTRHDNGATDIDKDINTGMVSTAAIYT